MQQFKVYRAFSVAMFALAGLLVVSTTGFAQMNEKDQGLERRTSPLAISKINHDNTYIKITYSQPQKEGRDIFGNLVPYDKIWRTGANEATEITFTNPVTFAGKKVEAGTYALFTIPHKGEWTIILNNELGQWGAFKYNKSKDYLRVTVPSQKLDKTVEVFSIGFSKPKNNSTTLSMKWDQTGVEIPISF